MTRLVRLQLTEGEALVVEKALVFTSANVAKVLPGRENSNGRVCLDRALSKLSTAIDEASPAEARVGLAEVEPS